MCAYVLRLLLLQHPQLYEAVPALPAVISSSTTAGDWTFEIKVETHAGHFILFSRLMIEDCSTYPSSS